jgi:hypothetical protein
MTIHRCDTVPPTQLGPTDSECKSLC